MKEFNDLSNISVNGCVNIFKNGNYKISNNTLKLLLLDKTTNKNIIWATDNYQNHGLEYTFYKEINIHLITGENKNIIQPRVKKSISEKQKRVKEKAEVFTPAWVCNYQNNIVDEIWFNRKNVFNKEVNNSWEVSSNKIEFLSKSWKDYVLDLRIEITCGEAPYIVSRYDSVTGEYISVKNRIGILDRKLRIVGENTKNENQWIEWAIKAYESTYAYEWQGDNLLIARLNLLYTFIEYYETKFEKVPSSKLINTIADIISWNVWQMDGLKGVIPNSCSDSNIVRYNLFDEPVYSSCLGCQNQNIHHHNGVYSIIKNWKKNQLVRFIDIL